MWFPPRLRDNCFIFPRGKVSRSRKVRGLGQIDTESLEIRRRQQVARIEELELRKESALLQIEQADVQLKYNQETLEKTEKLLSQGGASQQSRDELATKVRVDQASLEILRSNYKLLLAQQEELQAGLELSDLAIRNATILSPVDGIILNRFHRGRGAGQYGNTHI